MNYKSPPKPQHVPGTNKGEETTKYYGREAGREVSGTRGYRSARDSTSVNADDAGPIDPRMPQMPPA
jgi:hypothetical protein